MKKVIKGMCMMALVALAFTSCKKEQQSSFTASIESFVVEDEDRAYINENKDVIFEVGDRVMIFNISENDPHASHCAAYKAVQTGNVVDFVNCGEGTVGDALDGGFYAYYPSSLVVDASDPEMLNFMPDRVITELEFYENKSKFYVAPEQVYRPNKVARKDLYMAAHCDNSSNLHDAKFEMWNICGILALKPHEDTPRTVTEIRIVDNRWNLSGWVELVVPGVDKDLMTTLFNNFDPTVPSTVTAVNDYLTSIEYCVEEAGDTITLRLPEGGVQLGTTKETTPVFNIVLRPLALSCGSHIYFTFSDGSTQDVDFSNKNYKIKPGVIKSLGLDLDNWH